MLARVQLNPCYLVVVVEPWPPWGGDEDDGEPESREERAHRLAKSIIKFEKEIAEASLDL